MVKLKRSNFELEKRAEWWLNLSNLILASIALPTFFTELAWYAKGGIFVGGVLFALWIANVGFEFAGLVKK